MRIKNFYYNRYWIGWICCRGYNIVVVLKVVMLLVDLERGKVKVIYKYSDDCFRVLNFINCLGKGFFKDLNFCMSI